MGSGQIGDDVTDDVHDERQTYEGKDTTERLRHTGPGDGHKPAAFHQYAGFTIALSDRTLYVASDP